MGIDTQTWRARIGMLPGFSKGPNRSPNNKINNTQVFPSFDNFIKLVMFIFLEVIPQVSNAISAFIAFCCLFFLIIFELLLISVFTAYKQCKPSPQFLKLSLIHILSLPNLVAFFSIVLRLLLLKSGDVEKNPGPKTIPLSFGCWNVDSLLARQGVKKDYIESIQSIHNFDIFGICESYLSSETKPEDLVVKSFSATPFRADYKGPSSRPRGGVCLYYEESIPIKHRPDLELLDETIVAEIKLNRKSIIYILSYRSPSQTASEFADYLRDLNKLYTKAKSENPYMIILNGDFNARSPHLWKDE